MQPSTRSGDRRMRAFPVRLPSGARYWTVLDEGLAVVPVADGFLRQVRFGRDGAESTTKSYAHSIALFLRWCARTGRTWQAGAGQLGLFMTWLTHAGPAASGAGGGSEGMVLAGPGGEVCGLRRGDVHLLADSRPLGCEIARAHLHVVRRDDNPNGAWAKSRRQRAVPLDFLTVRAFDTYALERMAVSAAAGSDFVLVNLFRAPVGAPMRPGAIGDLLGAASRRSGLAAAVTPHQLRHAFGSSAADAGCGIDVVADLLGHASVSSSQVYLHPDPGRLRAAVDAVPSPREQAGATS